MSTRSALTLALAVLVLVPGAAGVVPGIAGSADPGLAPQPATDAEVEYDSTLLRVDPRENGTAAWTIEYRVDLDDENTTDAFESLGDNDIGRLPVVDGEGNIRGLVTRTDLLRAFRIVTEQRRFEEDVSEPLDV